MCLQSVRIFFCSFAAAIFLNLHQECIGWMFGAMTQFVADASIIPAKRKCLFPIKPLNSTAQLGVR